MWEDRKQKKKRKKKRAAEKDNKGKLVRIGTCGRWKKRENEVKENRGKYHKEKIKYSEKEKNGMWGRKINWENIKMREYSCVKKEKEQGKRQKEKGD